MLLAVMDYRRTGSGVGWPAALLALIVVTCVFPLTLQAPSTELPSSARKSTQATQVKRATDSKKAKMDIEPMWFQLDTASNSKEQQQARTSNRKRTAERDRTRPVKVFSTLNQFAEHERKVRRGLSEQDESPASHFNDLWQMNSQSAPHVLTKKSVAVCHHLEEEFPECLRRYLQDANVKNNDSVKKLFQCLAKEQCKACNDARASRLFQRDDSYQPGHLYERKMVRKRKYTQEKPVQDHNLQIQKEYVNADSEEGGRIFERSVVEHSHSRQQDEPSVEIISSKGESKRIARRRYYSYEENVSDSSKEKINNLAQVESVEEEGNASGESYEER